MRDVRTGDQQHDADGDEQQQHRRAEIANDDLFQRRDGDIAIGAGKAGLEPGRQDIHRRLRLRDADAWCQPPEDP
jgi:hypothetical protein